ncbi:hypothetical protein SRABI106_04024 [Rahnella aquatilis]|nr:hypothetical protein SRABI106_04024 [Rahnella aquatilis]
MMANTAPVRASSSTSPVRDENKTLTPEACMIGVAAPTISSSASKISPSPIPTRPICPARVCLRLRKNATPTKISSGESQERSKVRIRAITAVPTSAPRIITSAGASATSPCDTNDVTSSAVALLLCTRAVTPMPATNASGFFSTLLLRTRRRLAPKTRMMPVRTMCVPHTSREIADNKCKRVNTKEQLH